MPEELPRVHDPAAIGHHEGQRLVGSSEQNRPFGGRVTEHADHARQRHLTAQDDAFVDGMPEHDGGRLVPAEGGGELLLGLERGRAHDHEPALVEEGQGVELARPPGRLARRGGDHELVLPVVERPLGGRERRPDQRVHQVVPRARAGRNAPCLDACIIHRCRITRSAAAPRDGLLPLEPDPRALAEHRIDDLGLRKGIPRRASPRRWQGARIAVTGR